MGQCRMFHVSKRTLLEVSKCSIPYRFDLDEENLSIKDKTVESTLSYIICLYIV